MWAARYWAPRYWAPRYWPKVGAAVEPEPPATPELFRAILSVPRRRPVALQDPLALALVLDLPPGTLTVGPAPVEIGAEAALDLTLSALPAGRLTVGARLRATGALDMPLDAPPAGTLTVVSLAEQMRRLALLGVL